MGKFTVDPNLPTVQENQANAALTQDGTLVPFSVGSWIAQNNGVAPGRGDPFKSGPSSASLVPSSHAILMNGWCCRGPCA